MELRDRAVSPWPIPPARTPFEIEASLLDSDVQELLGTEDLAGDEPVSGPQLQWATHTDFPTVVTLLELNCCAIHLTAAGGGGGVCAVPAKAVAGPDLGGAGRRSRRSPCRWTVRSCTSFGLLPSHVLSNRLMTCI